jgi:hypothetical protein
MSELILGLGIDSFEVLRPNPPEALRLAADVKVFKNC